MRQKVSFITEREDDDQERGASCLAVAVDKVSQLIGQNASAGLRRELATGQVQPDVLLHVTGCSLQEAHHQLLEHTVVISIERCE
jgi:hypothetical protein